MVVAADVVSVVVPHEYLDGGRRRKGISPFPRVQVVVLLLSSQVWLLLHLTGDKPDMRACFHGS